MRHLTIPLSILLLVGCNSMGATPPGQYVLYRGDISNFAELSLDQTVMVGGAGVVLFDGQPLTDISSLRVPPGKHLVAADCGMVWAHGPPVVEHVFEASTRYRLVCNGHAPAIVAAE